jgi:hypothetical protein
LCKVVYMVKILKETMSPYMIRIMYFSNFESCLRYGIILWGRDRASDSIFKLQKRVLQVICGVNSRTSCRQIFKDYNILTLPSLYILTYWRWYVLLKNVMFYGKECGHP